MPRLRRRQPAYRLHKASGQAVVVLDGKMFYLGRYGSESSHAEYDRLLALWLAHGRRMPASDQELVDLTVTELIESYVRHVRIYYVKNGLPTKEQANIRIAMRPLHRLYGRTAAAKFGPAALKAVRQSLIDRDLSRSYINDQTGRIKRMFKWAAENELVSAQVYHGLSTVAGLRRGRSEARETEPVKPVHEAHVQAIQPHVSRQVWAMIELQRLTGMRPGEAVIMRACDIDMTGDLWEYRPSSHKGEHHDRERIIPLGPRSQAVSRRG